jgi:uncharacterized protein DUF1259
MKYYAPTARSYSHELLVFITMLALAGCGDTGQTGKAASAAPPDAAASGTAVTDSTDWKAVDQAMGRSGKLQPGDVYKYSLPRSDLRVSAGGVAVKPALALGSWVSFKRNGGNTSVMGDLVLTEHEIAPVISRLQEMGVEQTALHNHLLHESPRIMYLHIHAHGDAVEIAQAVRAALALTKTPPAKPDGAEPRGQLELDTLAVAQDLGYSGKVSGGVYQVSVPRAEAVRADAMEVPPSMGVATAINLQPLGRGRAAATGDFVMTAQEVNPVLKALREAGIEVTALHSHMLNEEPRLFFAHFWGNDDIGNLTRGLRLALDKMNVKRATS